MTPTLRSKPRPTPVLLTGAAALALLLAACSQGGSIAPSAATSAAPSVADSAAPSEAASTAPSAQESTSESMAEGQVVTITGTSFGVAEIDVAAGDTVTWVNDSALPHTVTEGQNGQASDGSRFSEQVSAGQSVEITFTDPGDYQVTCLFHSNMNMVVHVQ